MLLDKERRSHLDDFNFDEAVGLFAGLNIPPKKSYAIEYSYRTGRDHQYHLLADWVGALAPLLFPQANSFALDFIRSRFEVRRRHWSNTICPAGAKPVPAC